MPFGISRSFFWFLVAGGLAFLVDVGVLTLLRDVLGVYAARAVSFWLAATTTWLINRNISFAGRHASGGLWPEYLRYLGLMLGGGAVNLAVYSLLAWALPQGPWWLMLYVAAGTVAGLAVNYLGLSRLLYRAPQKD
ncbi:putative flippase GtrA [Comamonas odontotermitis]|uniref:Flippase GtrA n=1 Tax=Comamonas odontotermitis TaxID=379895 RepID=A0ABR6RKG7_9BURK|nr:GtrA family protein [Comamonas odontotermitis]MBB6579663.1 putative flippase GtrA [Comamonas odontotermitis]